MAERGGTDPHATTARAAFEADPASLPVLVPWRRAENMIPTRECDPLSRRSRCACPVHSPDDDGRTLSRSYLPSLSSGAAVAATPAWEYRESNPSYRSGEFTARRASIAHYSHCHLFRLQVELVQVMVHLQTNLPDGGSFERLVGIEPTLNGFADRYVPTSP